MARRVIARPELSSADSALADRDPEHGAGRREGLLLAAYALLFVVGVWTVVVSELVSQEPTSLRPNNVTEPTQKPSPTAP